MISLLIISMHIMITVGGNTPARNISQQDGNCQNEHSSELFQVHGSDIPALPLGMCDFDNIIRDRKIIVDKSAWIFPALTGEAFKLITRPRRFGKSTNLSMLKTFLQKDPEIENMHLFANFSIHTDPKYEALRSTHQNKYAVISFDFLHISKGALTPEKFEKSFVVNVMMKLRELYREYEQYLTPHEEEDLRFAINKETLDFVYEGFKILISALTSRKYKIAVLIDEYDAPFTTAVEAELSSQQKMKTVGESELYKGNLALMKQFYNFFFKDGLKSLPDLGIMIGISCVAKDGLFSDLSNFESFSIFDDNTFSPYFGLTTTEVKWILAKTKSQLSFKEVIEWYDGYKFGNVTIFNPFSVVKAISKNDFRQYWGHSGSAEMIKTVIDYSGSGGMQDLYFLLSGHTLTKKIEPSFQHFFKREESYWGLLASAGYINAVKTNEENIYTIKIPSKEVREYLRLQFPTQLVNIEREYGEFLTAFNSLEKNETESLKKSLETKYNAWVSPYFNLDVNASIENFGKHLESLLTGLPKDKVVSDTFKENGTIVYQTIIIKSEFVFMFNCARTNAKTPDTASELATQLLRLPPSNGNTLFLKKLWGARKQPIQKMFILALSIVSHLSDELVKQGTSVVIKELIIDPALHFFKHHIFG